jgi:nucleoid-associated protein YgaU
MGERASRTGNASTTSPRPRQATVRTHFVKEGDSLSGISKKFYGTTEHWMKIQSANNLTNPNQVRIGTRLVIPNLDAGGTSATTTTVASARPQTTTVREGENLSDIAKRELGNRNLWKLIWSANKASLPDPDVLRVGMTLQIPVVTARN